MKKQFDKFYIDTISLENLLLAWQEFLPGKRRKLDVQRFSLNLTDNLVQLHSELADFSYKHGGYYAFNISDPKPRNIHKAAVRDRVLHHAVYRQLYPFFDRTFIADSFSCRIDKGVHKALNRFREFGRKVSKNHTRTVWVLKLDIRNFFASIDHEALLRILREYISDKDIILLLENVISSFSSEQPYVDRHMVVTKAKGLPLGNLTSQLFCNVYMNELDQFAKHKLKAEYYIRYADDFILLSDNRTWLTSQIFPISDFLQQKLRLSLHPGKIFLKTLASGVDFFGVDTFFASPDCPAYHAQAHVQTYKRARRERNFAVVSGTVGAWKHL